MSCCGIGSEAMSSMVRSAKQEGGYKNSCILETVCLMLGALPICVVVGGTTTLVFVPQCHFNAHMHSRDAFWVLDSHFICCIYCIHCTHMVSEKVNDKERYSLWCFQVVLQCFI